MAGDYPRRDNFDDEQKWRKAVSKWLDKRLIKLPSSSAKEPAKGQYEYDSSTTEHSSSEEELQPGAARVILDRQERVIVQQLFEAVGKDQEIAALKKELDFERKRIAELEEVCRRNKRR